MCVSSMSSPRVLVLTWHSPAGAVLERVFGGARVTVPRANRAMTRPFSADAVVVDVAAGASSEQRAHVRSWVEARVRAGTSALVLCERDELLWPSEITEAPYLAKRPSAPVVQMAKPSRGPELRGILSWTLGTAVTRDPGLDGRSEELMLCALRVAQRLGLTAREMDLVVRALELRDRDEIAARMGVSRAQVDALARRVAARSTTSLEGVVRQAWLDWVDSVADDEGSGQFGARSRKGSGEVVQGLLGLRTAE